jgi:hypothetical protein
MILNPSLTFERVIPMFIEDEIEEVIYNTFMRKGLAVKRSLVAAIADDIINHFIDEGYMQIVEVSNDD